MSLVHIVIFWKININDLFSCENIPLGFCNIMLLFSINMIIFHFISEKQMPSKSAEIYAFSANTKGCFSEKVLILFSNIWSRISSVANVSLLTSSHSLSSCMEQFSNKCIDCIIVSIQRLHSNTTPAHTNLYKVEKSPQLNLLF